MSLVEQTVKKAKKLFCGPSEEEGDWGPELTEYLRLSKATKKDDEGGRKAARAAQKKIPVGEWQRYLRASRMKLFMPQNAQIDKIKKCPSPSGRYTLEVCPFKTGENTWNYSKGTIRNEHNIALISVYRNYGHFWHCWVEHANGKEYLFCGEDYQGFTLIDLDRVAEYARYCGGGIDDGDVDIPGRQDYLPDRAKQGFGWCPVVMHPSPDGTVLAVEGCYWACPYEIRFYDFSKPENGLPMHLIDVTDAEERIDGWVDNNTFVYQREIEDEDKLAEMEGTMGDDEWDKVYETNPESLGYSYVRYEWKREEVSVVQELTDAIDQWGQEWDTLMARQEYIKGQLEESKTVTEKFKRLFLVNRGREGEVEAELREIKKKRKEMREEQGRLWKIRGLIHKGHLGKSRWGLHPCKYEHYRKLKFLNHKLMQAQIMQAAYERYWRKDPQNRVIKKYERNAEGQKISYTTRPKSDPKLCSVLTKERVRPATVTTSGQVPIWVERNKDAETAKIVRSKFFEDRGVWTADPGIVEDYKLARYPVKTAQELQPLKLAVSDVDALVARFPDNPWGLVPNEDGEEGTEGS